MTHNSTTKYIGDNILCFGDCLEVLPKLGTKCNLILVDPPYGITKYSWDKVIPYKQFWQALHSVANNNTAIVIFSKLPFMIDIINANRKEFRYEWIYSKSHSTGFLTSKHTPLHNHENVLVFYKQRPTYNPQMINVEAYKKSFDITKNIIDALSYKDTSNRYPQDIISFSNWNGYRFGNRSENAIVHPTQKPVKLLEYLIRTYTNIGDTVIDCCMGSASTGIACINTCRKFIGIEKDKTFYNIAKQRITQAFKEDIRSLIPTIEIEKEQERLNNLCFDIEVIKEEHQRMFSFLGA